MVEKDQLKADAGSAPPYPCDSRSKAARTSDCGEAASLLFIKSLLVTYK